MQEPMKKSWYQKGSVQSAFVLGVFTLLAALITSRPQLGNVSEGASQKAPVETAETLQAFSLPNPLVPESVPAGVHPSSGEAEPPERAGEKIVNENRSAVLNRIMTLQEGSPKQIESLDTVVTFTFQETLGSEYAEFVLSVPGAPVIRFPSRRMGSRQEFSVAGKSYELHVLGIDPEAKTAQIILRRGKVR